MYNKISFTWRSIVYLQVYIVKKWDRHRQYAKRSMYLNFTHIQTFFPAKYERLWAQDI